MIEAFSYRTKINSKEFSQTIYAKDIYTSLNFWLAKIDDLQNEVFSFDKEVVSAIQSQIIDKSAKILKNDFNHHIVFSIKDIICITYIDKLKIKEPDFTANLYYLKTTEGGRKNYARSGYRPHFKIDAKKEITSAEQIFIEKDKVFPGESINAEIRLLSKDQFTNLLYNNLAFKLYEGDKMIAKGQIMEVINKDLKRP